MDDITIEQYEREVEANLVRLAEQLREGKYQPKAIRRTYIPKPDGTMRPWESRRFKTASFKARSAR